MGVKKYFNRHYWRALPGYLATKVLFREAKRTLIDSATYSGTEVIGDGIRLTITAARLDQPRYRGWSFNAADAHFHAVPDLSVYDVGEDDA